MREILSATSKAAALEILARPLHRKRSGQLIQMDYQNIPKEGFLSLAILQQCMTAPSLVQSLSWER